MGNRRRVIGSQKPSVAIAKTGINVNGCAVLFAHPDGVKAASEGKQFASDFARVISRSMQVNVCDIMEKSLEMRERLLTKGTLND